MSDTPFHPVTLAALRMPVRVCLSAWLEHGPFAFWLIDAVRPRTVVELGVHNGFSYCCFCQAIVDGALASRAWAIDTWRGDAHAGMFGDEVLQDLRRHHDARYGAFSELIQSTFDDAVSRFDDGSIDILHIDGRHFYEDVRHDFETWRPKLSERGVVLFHDIAVHERGFGVAQFWNEIADAYPSFAFTHGHGLGVLAVGPDVPGEILALCAAPETEASEIRSAYARLGRDVAAMLDPAGDGRDSAAGGDSARRQALAEERDALAEENRALRRRLSESEAQREAPRFTTRSLGTLSTVLAAIRRKYFGQEG